MFPVQVDVRPLGFSAPDVEVPPPVGESCQRVPRVFVQTIMEFIPSQTKHHTDYEDNRPVGLDQWKELAGQHVEVLLALGGVEKIRDERVLSAMGEIRGGLKREVHSSYTCFPIARLSRWTMLIGLRHASVFPHCRVLTRNGRWRETGI